MSTAHFILAYRILFLFAFTLLPLASFTQVEQLGYLENAQNSIVRRFSMNSKTDLLCVRRSPCYDFWKVNYAEGTYSLLDSACHILTDGNFISGTKGVFYSTYEYLQNGNDIRYFLHYVDTAGVKNTSAIIATNIASNTQDYGPVLLQVIDNELYYTFRQQNGQHELWKTGPDLSNPVPVHTFTEKIVQSLVYQDSLIVFTRNTGNYSVYNCSVAGGAEFRYSLQCTGNQVSVSLVGKKDDDYFLSVLKAPGQYDVWKTDFTQQGTSVFINNNIVSNLEFDYINGFTFVKNDFRQELWKGDYTNPQNRVKVPFESEIEGYGTQIDKVYSRNIFRLLNFRYGIELAQIENDTIRMMKDLAPNAKSGVLAKPDYAYYIPLVSVADGPDTSFLIMSNGNDGLKYLYSVKDGVYKSYFPIEQPEEMVDGKRYGDYFYWYRNNASGLQLLRGSLVNGLQPQPEEQPLDSSLTWSRELGYPVETYNYWQDLFVADYNTGVELLEDGSVLGCFMLRDYYENKIVSSEGYSFDSVQAAIILFKYDPYGNIKWTQSFGDKNTFFFTAPQFMTDSDGDIMVSGTFYEKGFFAADTDSVNGAAFFLAKLDGETGEILWHKTIAESFFVNDIEMQKMTIGENNSIYLSILYRNFGCTIDGINLFSNLNPVNAVAKFTTDGEIEWFKNTPTPWTNYYGNTYISEYNPETEKLITCQSQGYYNTSSTCNFMKWGYYIQMMDQSGNNLQQRSVLTSDLGGMTAGTLIGNSLAIFGYFRGNMAIDEFTASTPYSGFCQVNRGFQLVYSPEKNKFTSLQTSIETFHPLDSKSDGANFYVYGTDQHHNLLVIRFNQKGEETGYKMLGQFANPFDYEKDQFMDVSDEHLVFFGSYFQENDQYGVCPQYAFQTYKSIIKTENANWQTDKKWFEQVLFNAFDYTDQDVVVYPNPFTDQVTVVFQGFEASYTHYELWDVNGRKVTTGALGTEVMQSLNFGNLNAGTYVLKLISETKQTTVRMVKI